MYLTCLNILDSLSKFESIKKNIKMKIHENNMVQYNYLDTRTYRYEH